MDIPHQVIQAAGELIQLFGVNFQHLGEYEGQDAWLFVHPENTCTGFPDIFLLKDDVVTPVSGFDSLKILRSFNIE